MGRTHQRAGEGLSSGDDTIPDSEAGSKESTAYHEAGHAVLSTELGLAVHSVTIVPSGDNAGSCRYYRSRRWYERITEGGATAGDLQRAEHELMVSFAGIIAQQVHLGVDKKAVEAGFGRERWDDGTSTAVRGSDLDRGIDLTPMMCGEDEEEQGAYTNWLWIRTRNMLRQPRAWAAVEAVARELLAKDKLSGKEVSAIWRASYSRAFEQHKAKIPLPT
jgi:hypothetical protein